MKRLVRSGNPINWAGVKMSALTVPPRRGEYVVISHTVCRVESDPAAPPMFGELS
jgi:hypothetical protein